jgi:hypothetical protein
MNQTESKHPKQKAILLAKLGTLPELSNIVTELAQLLPGTRLLGIGAEGVSASPQLEVIAHERQLVLGAFDAWWKEQLYVDPDLYVKLLPRESQLLRTIERVVRHDVFQVDKPTFPTEPFRDTFDGRSQLLLRQIAFWDSILMKQNVAAVVAQSIPHNFWDAVLYAVTEAREIPYLFFHEVRPFLSSVYFYERLEEMGNLNRSHDLIQATKQRYGMVPDSVGRAEFMYKQVSTESTKFHRESGKKQKFTFMKRVTMLLRTPRHVPFKVYRSLTRRFIDYRSRRRENLVAQSRSLPGKYFLIELHIQGNATTLMKGYMYGEQREMVAHVSHSLPAGYSLLVRESSRQSSRKQPRREAFWQQISALPSVHIISDELDSKDVLLKSAGLIELGYSSLVMEAINLDVPVIVLGLTHLHGAPHAHVVTENSTLPLVLKQVSEQPQRRYGSPDAIQEGLYEWADRTRESTLQASLSTTFTNQLDSDPDFQVRILKNVSRLVATWYQERVK